MLDTLTDQVGWPVRDTVAPHVWDASIDTIRNFARAYGDDNPLFSDHRYAGRSVREGIIAPPLFPIAAGLPADRAGRRAVDLDAIARGRAQSVVDDRWTLSRPITCGVRLERERTLSRVRAVAGAYEATVRTVYRANGVQYAVHDRTRGYRAASDGGRLPEDRPLAQYSDDDLARIDAMYETEARRRAERLAIDDVQVGDRVGPMMKGPLTVTDLVAYRAGVGPGPLGGEPLRLALQNRRLRPGLYDRMASNAFDITERRHYDERYAQSLGYLSAYDYSHTRLTWFSHLLTDWVGDGGWVWQLSGVMHANNYVGDYHVLEGVVTEVASGVPCAGVGSARISLTAQNQLGQTTYSGEAVALLPAAGVSHVATEHFSALSGAGG